MKTLLSNKCRLPVNVTLVKEDNVISDNGKIADIFNDFFTNVVKNLNFTVSGDIRCEANNIKDPVLKAIGKYNRHPNIKAIAGISKSNNFILEKVSYEEILHEIKQLDTRKACQDTDVPSKIIKMNSDIFADFLYQNFNDTIATSVFPQNLKNANITPVFKKGDRNSETNYRPVSILPNLSQIYERCLYKQLSKFFDKILSRYQCGFRKGFNSQHCLATMLEKWRETLNKGDCFGALSSNLSKAFECILHDLLIAKLHAYGVETKSLKFLDSYSMA